jgi:cell division septal protein FtsQ
MTQVLNMDKNEKYNKTKGTDTASSKSSSNPLPWIAGAILILGLAVMAGLYWSSTMTVQRVQFSGNHFVPTSDLKEVEVPTGIRPDSMDLGNIMNHFEQIPYIKQADISVEPNGNLMINITERQPIALLADGEKKIYIDQDGLRLPLRLGKTVDVPILYGFSATPRSDTLKSKAFKKVSDFLITVRSNQISNATISEVAWTKKEGVVALTNQNGVKLIFGKGDFSTRLRNWEAFYGEVVKQKGIEAMRSIDLRFEGQIVTREQ